MKNIKVQKRISHNLVFSKWKRKSFSIFQTLKKEVIISVLSVIYFLSVPTLSIAENDDTTQVKIQYDLDEIEVSAQRSPALYSQIARVITVIDRKDIEALPSQSVQDLLEYVAGVDIRQRGAEDVQADVSIRGGTFDQTLILLNGINITDPQTGHHNLNLPLSLNQIEKIEILEGPAARIYGPNAFSGAINIITRKPDSSLIQGEITGGSNRYFDGNFFTSIHSGNFNQQISAGRKSSDGYINNTDFKIINVFYSNKLNTKKGNLSFQGGFTKKGFGANSFYTPKYPNQYEETKTLLTSVKWESNSKLHISPAVYWRQHQDRFELFRNNPPSWYNSHNYHLTNVYGANVNSWFNWLAGKTAIGVEIRSENILSNVLGNDLDNPQKVPGEDAEFTKSDTRNYVSGFLEHAIYHGKWSFTTGLMGNYISGSDLGLNVFPGIDLSYELKQALKLFSSFNTSLRMPTFTDLYYSGPTNIGNPNLKPEKSATLEGGLKWSSKLVRGQLVLFYRNGKDIIDWVKLDNDDLWQPMNLTQLKSLGAELQSQFNLKQQFGKYYPNKVYINYFYNNLEKKEVNFISNYVLDHLKHKLIISVNQDIIKNLSIEVKANFQDRAGTYTKFEDENWIGEVNYDPFWLFDTKLCYRYSGINAFTIITNIFNTSYYDLGNVTQPGRWLKIGISYQIGFK